MNVNESTDIEMSPKILPAAPNQNPISISSLKVKQNFAETLGVQKLTKKIPIRKPPSQWFIRVHPSEEYRIQTAMLQLKEEMDGGMHFVSRDLWDDLASEIRPQL